MPRFIKQISEEWLILKNQIFLFPYKKNFVEKQITLSSYGIYYFPKALYDEFQNKMGQITEK